MSSILTPFTLTQDASADSLAPAHTHSCFTTFHKAALSCVLESEFRVFGWFLGNCTCGIKSRFFPWFSLTFIIPAFVQDVISAA